MGRPAFRDGLAILLSAATWLAGAVAAVAGEATPNLAGLMRIEVYPAEITVTSSRDRYQLVVTGFFENGDVRDLTRQAAFHADHRNVVAIDRARVISKGDGSATIEARVGAHVAESAVAVSGWDRPNPVRFHAEVLAVLTKQGCNAGSCHGSPEGKGGFSLSLMAYAPHRDEEALIRGGLGRRTERIEPDESLLLKKPMLRITHVGGKRLRKSDTAYGILRNWISEGAHADPPGTSECTGIVVYPPSSRLLRLPQSEQQLSVLAQFSDGTVRDVTAIATYSTSNADLLSCDASGYVLGHRRGVAAIMVRYLSHVESVYFTVVETVDGFEWNHPAENGYIDRLVHAKLRELQILPGELCDDGTFVRRIHLDLTGLLPGVEQTRAFLADTAGDKRKTLIDELLASEEFARFWAMKTADLMRVNQTVLKEGRAELFAAWLRDSWRNDQPFDSFTREILTATGETKTNPPANYFFAIPKNEEVTETTAQLFMGSRINCAKCHNHPFENWTQDDYYRIAAVFVRTKNEKGTIIVKDSGEAKHPSTGSVMQPWGSEASTNKETSVPSDRRDAFVDWLTEASNPFFARVEVNRLWAHLMGKGIVNPIDDFRSSNPPNNPELLDALAADFEQSGYDRVHIIRMICNSRTYQRSPQTNRFNQDDELFFSHYVPRRLAAEQLHDAVGFATQTLPPTSTISAELSQKQKQLDAVVARLPEDRPVWEGAVLETLQSEPCWQGCWRFVGAFSAKDFDEAAATVYPPETERDLDFTRTYNEGKLKWEKHPEWEDGEVYLIIQVKPGPYYLARKIHANRPGKAVLSFGGNGSMEVWLNGTVVLDKTEKRALNPDDVRVDVDLVAGENNLLFKVANGGGLFGFYYQLVSFDGRAPSKLDVPLDVAELVAIPADRRTEAQRKDLVEQFESNHTELAALRDRVSRLTDWLDYQTQRPYPEQNEFLRAFGQPKRESACACERMSEPTIDQALQSLNGDLVRTRTADGAEHYASLADDRQMLRELYLSALSRAPTNNEFDVALAYLNGADDRKQAVEDLLWALLNTREFMFQH